MALTRYGTPYYTDLDDPWNLPLSSWDPFGTRELSLRPALKRTRDAVREFSPLLATDIVEGPDDFHVHVDLPGVLPEDLEINIANGYVHLKAERRQTHKENIGLTHSIERSFGRISRSLQLPPRANPDTAKATFKNGVLSISFEKVNESSRCKRITIN